MLQYSEVSIQFTLQVKTATSVENKQKKIMDVET